MSNPHTPHASVMAVVAACLAAPASADVTAIYTNIPGHPTAQVPGVPGEQFRSPLVPFLTLNGSPDGAHWIFKAITDNPDSNASEVIVVGSGTTGIVVAKEGDPVPSGGGNYGFMDSDCGINDAGHYVFGNRLDGPPTTQDESILLFDGLAIGIAVREGDPAPNLFDPDGAGDELFGNNLNSSHILNDDTPAFHADLIQNINTGFRSALYHGSTVQAQEGTQIGALAGVDIYGGFTALSGNTFSSSADGSDWIVEADLDPGIGTEEGAVVNGNVVVRDGELIKGLQTAVDAIFEVDMGGNGDWFVRGETFADITFALRNGELIAVEGGPITPGSTELYTSLSDLNANTAGDWIVTGETSEGSQVIVLNGDTVVLRAGEGIDLGVGPSSVAFVDRVSAFDTVISDQSTAGPVNGGGDDRKVYAFTTMVDKIGQELGQAFIVVDVATSCPWDCGDPSDGVVDTIDFLALLAQWSLVGTSCDFDDNGVDTVDFLALLAAWGDCP